MTNVEFRQEHIEFQVNLYESKNPTRCYLHNARREWILSVIKQVLQDEPVFFEIGIGCGIYTKVMSELGKVFAIDINPNFVAAANRLPNVTANVADITQISFKPVHDIALCSEVLEHITDSATSLKNIYASLKPDGHLILTTPNSYSTVELTARLLSIPIFVKLASLIYGEAVDDLGHVNRMTKKTLEAQILDAGFEIVLNDNLAFYLPVIAEFGGNTGARICKWFAKKLRGTGLAWLLWTQCWVLRKPSM